MKRLVALIIGLCAMGIAHADPVVYELPNTAVGVGLIPTQIASTTTIAVGGKSYSGASTFYYVSECVKPDSVHYHCSVLQEDNVILVAKDGSTITATLRVEKGTTLVTSGHNYWKPFARLIGGEVQVP